MAMLHQSVRTGQNQMEENTNNSDQLSWCPWCLFLNISGLIQRQKLASVFLAAARVCSESLKLVLTECFGFESSWRRVNVCRDARLLSALPQMSPPGQKSKIGILFSLCLSLRTLISCSGAPPPRSDVIWVQLRSDGGRRNPAGGQLVFLSKPLGTPASSR